MSGSVSVVVPTFNREELLERALRSALAQTRPAEEVVVIDDGSNDGTGSMVSSKFPQVVYLHQSNRGVSAARNRGIRRAVGEWIALLDSDDEWLPEKLERQLVAIDNDRESESPPLLCHTDEIWYRRGVRVNPGARHRKGGGFIFQKCLPLCVVSPSSALIHRRVFDEIGFFDESLPACEDYDFWLRFAARYPVLYVDEPLVLKHGGREDQLSSSVWGLDRFRIRALQKILEHGKLGEADRQAAKETLVEKIDLFTAGAQKRGRRVEVEELMALRARYARGSSASASLP